MLKYINVYFNETSSGKFVPRSLIVDNDPTSLDSIMGSDMSKFYDRDNIVTGLQDSDNNWGTGHYIQGQEISDSIEDKVRKECESTECFHGFQMFSSMSGGTGGGTSSRVMSKIREEYPDRTMVAFNVFPSATSTSNPMSLYNTTHTCHYSIENADIVNVFDNEGLYETCSTYHRMASPTMDDFNEKIGKTAVDFGAMLSYPDRNNSDWRNVSTTMI